MKRSAVLLLSVVLASILAACTLEEPPTDLAAQGRSAPVTYLISNASSLPASFADLVARRGDTLEAFHAEAGFASVTTSRPQAYRRYADVIVQNVRLERELPGVEPVAVSSEEVEALLGNPPTSADDDPLYDLQWGNDAVNAAEAYNAGVTGAGVRVAVLDGGFDLDHPDLASNIDMASSKNFVAGETLEYQLPDPFSHGTHVAGTIAAANNGFGTVGVAPEAELVLVKVLGDGGSGSFADVVSGILYAADVDSDVINMSLGADIYQGRSKDPAYGGNYVGGADVAMLRMIMNRAMSYAHGKGSTVIVSAGNDARDLDKDGSLTVFPASMPHAISISALGPAGWAIDPTTDLEQLALYSNYGRSGIDFGAPGGDYRYFIVDRAASCTVGPLTRPCYVFDFVFSTGSLNSWYWSVGTSMAAPHAAGVAALIISENGGSMDPARVEAELASRAADLGEPGHDAAYGSGAVRSGY